ncbi:MAG: AI-2E family transporter [Chloroflexi bacterium]|nr:AI-2E family transporter [Chloroflexota bacterium]
MIRLLLPFAILALVACFATTVLAPFVIAAILAYILSPLIDRLEERTRLPRAALVAVFAVLLIGTLVGLVWFLEARLAAEIRALRAAGPDIVQGAFAKLVGGDTLDVFGQVVEVRALAGWTRLQMNEILGRPSDALQLLQHAIEGVVKVFLTLMALFYFLYDGRRVGPYLLRFVPAEHRRRTREVGQNVHAVLGRFLRGQLFLIGLMIVVNYCVLEFIFRLPFALPIAIVSGVLEVIPLLGPILAGAIASVIALAHGGVGPMAGVALAYLILRQLEDHFVMPFVVGRAVHLHPLIPIVSVLIGGAIGGILGAILAVPTAAALRVTLDTLYPPLAVEEPLTLPPAHRSTPHAPAPTVHTPS